MGACLAKIQEKAVLPSVKLPGLSKEESTRIEERTKELCEVFTIQYLKAYKSNLIKKIRDEVNESPEGNKKALVWKKPAAEPPVRLSGTLEKSDSLEKVAFKSSFIEIDTEWSFKIHAKEGAKAEATLNLFGYKVKAFDSKSESKQHALAVQHSNEDKPSFVLQFKDEDEYSKWKSMIEKTIKKSKNLIATEPWLVKTFLEAYQQTRWICWLWTSWEADESAGELLGGLFYEILDREIVSDILSKIDQAAVKKGVRTAVRKIVNKAVEAAWAAIQKAILPAREVVEKVAKASLGELFTAEKKLKDAIIDKSKKDIIEPGVDRLKPLLQKAFEHVLEPLEQASIEELSVFNENISEIVKELSRDGVTSLSDADRERAIHNAIWYVDCSWWGRQRKVSNKLYEVIEAHSDDYDLRRCIWDLIYDYVELSVLSMRVLHEELAERLGASTDVEGTIAAVKEVGASVASKLSHDILLVNEMSIVKLLNMKASATVGEHIMSALNKILEPMSDAVPDVAKDIIDPVRTGQEVVDSIVEEASIAIVQSGFVNIVKSIDRHHENIKIRIVA